MQAALIILTQLHFFLSGVHLPPVPSKNHWHKNELPQSQMCGSERTVLWPVPPESLWRRGSKCLAGSCKYQTLVQFIFSLWTAILKMLQFNCTLQFFCASVYCLLAKLGPYKECYIYNFSDLFHAQMVCLIFKINIPTRVVHCSCLMWSHHVAEKLIHVVLYFLDQGIILWCPWFWIMEGGLQMK